MVTVRQYERYLKLPFLRIRYSSAYLTTFFYSFHLLLPLPPKFLKMEQPEQIDELTHDMYSAGFLCSDHHIPFLPLVLGRQGHTLLVQTFLHLTRPEPHAAIRARRRDQVRCKACWVDGGGTEMTSGRGGAHNLNTIGEFQHLCTHLQEGEKGGTVNSWKI